MALKTSLINGTRFIITAFHVLLVLFVGEELMLVGKDLLVPRAQIAHLLMVDAANVTVKVGPAETGEVAGIIWTIVAEE